MRFSTLERIWFVQIVRCGNVILSSVHGWLTALKSVTCTQSSSPIALFVKHQNHCLEKVMHCLGNWETIGYTTKRWSLWLREMRWRDAKQDVIWMILGTQGDEMERWEERSYLDAWVIWISESVLWTMRCISLTTIRIYDIVHTIYIIMLRDLMYWVTSFLNKHSSIYKFEQHWAMMAPYPSFAWFRKSYNQVIQYSGREIQALGRLIVPVFPATLVNDFVSLVIPFTEALKCITNIVYVHHMEQFRYHTEVIIECMENYLE